MSTRAADDFPAINARMRELEAERTARINASPLDGIASAYGAALDVLAEVYGVRREFGEPDWQLRVRAAKAVGVI